MDERFSAYAGDEPYVFVCYAHADAEVVYAEITRLRDQGINIWYDEGIAGGTVWRAQIAESIEGAEKFLYYISSASLQSEHCNREIYYAVDKSIEVIPVYLEDTALTPELALTLSRIQALYRNKDTNYEQHLFDVVKPDAARAPAKSRIPDARRSPVLPLALGFMAVLVAALLGWYAMQRAPATPATPANLETGPPAEPIVEVQPFSALSDGTALENHAIVVTQDIKDALAEQQGFVLSNRGATKADYILSGNLRNVSSGHRASVELQRTRDGLIVWSDALEDAIDAAGFLEFRRADYVAYTVGSLMKNARYRRFLEDAGATDNPVALNAFFAGLAENDAARVGDGSYATAMDHERRAITLDPQFTEPYAWLTLQYSIRAQGAIPIEEALTNAHQLAQQMRPLKRTPAVDFALAYMHLRLDLNYEEATRHIERAEASYFYPTNRMQMVKCQIAWTQGHMAEAIRLCTNAAATGGSLELYVLGNLLYISGRYREAIDAYQRSLEVIDGSQTKGRELGIHDNIGYQLLDMLARAQFHEGDVIAANATLRSPLARMSDQFPEKYAASLALLGETAEARQAIEILIDQDRRGYAIEPAQFFWAYLYLDDLDHAFEWALRAIDSRDFMLISALRASSLVGALRREPRFADLMARLSEIESGG